MPDVLSRDADKMRIDIDTEHASGCEMFRDLQGDETDVAADVQHVSIAKPRLQ
jgi:hypothetical protein